MTTVTHCRFPGDWEALYVDGELVAENHSVDVGDVLDAIEGHHVEEASSGWLSIDLVDHFGGRAPEQYEELDAVV
jgi:hypothetical protein